MDTQKPSTPLDKIFQIEIPLKDGPQFYPLILVQNVTKQDDHLSTFVLDRRHAYLELQRALGRWWRENTSMTDSKYSDYLRDRAPPSTPSLTENNNQHEQNSFHSHSEIFDDCLETFQTTLNLFTADTNGSIKKFDIESKRLKSDYGNFHLDFIQTMSVSPDGQFLYTGGGGESLNCLDLDLETDAPHKTIKSAHTNYVR